MSTGRHDDAPIAARVRHLESTLERLGVLAPGEIDAKVDDNARTGSPAHGARIVARAWIDGDFRRRLLEDANTAIRDLGLSMAGGVQEQRLEVVANSATTHNVIVCTLCSCYPISLLGPSPSWYKSEAYRARVVREPREVLREFGLELAPSVDITVWDASAESRYMVLPQRPPDTGALDEPALAELVTRKGLIGTALR
ncbi:nitrile hydratase subunit alpha [Pseudonocardia nematodicida]|uniref:Nitrile hydratase subunit alpha n=1 Tax=Pseudonocardia nematodicida TaxID=1206997 RepID=A0ABV1KGR2_9PSEU